MRHSQGKNFNVNEGDTITIYSGGKTYTGKAYSVHNWGRETYNKEKERMERVEDNWYIELEYDHPDPMMQVGYWKQSYDGGYITHINGKEVTS